MNMATPALELKELKKRFAEPAVAGLDLKIRPGEIYALLGPNAAGKTTTLRITAGLLPPDSGSVSVYGVDAINDSVAAKRLIAWVADEPLIYDKLTPLEYLDFIAGLWGMGSSSAEARAWPLLEVLGLALHAHERCESFSRGMRQKVALAGALIHEPKLLLLDEPLTGLDVGSARVVKELLRSHVRGGRAVVMTTHILEVAERMADRVGILNKGRLLAEGTIGELGKFAGRKDRALENIFVDLVTGARTAT